MQYMQKIVVIHLKAAQYSSCLIRHWVWERCKFSSVVRGEAQAAVHFGPF